MLHLGFSRDRTDWMQYAYGQYATTPDYLCNSLMIFDSLQSVVAKAERLLMYSSDWNVTSDDGTGQLLRKARDEYGVQLSPITVQHLSNDATWADSFTKLLAFNQTQFRRVLSLDSDSTVLQSMDELFLVPSAPVAMPRAYWLNDTLSSQIMLVEPSAAEFARVEQAMQHLSEQEFDMEIVNQLYGESCMVLSHRKYDLLTGEFRGTEHARYLGSDSEVWDPEAMLTEAKFVHFSDWPLPKPWLLPGREVEFQETRPACQRGGNDEQDCRDREVWTALYEDFARRRERVCGDAVATPVQQVEKMPQIAVAEQAAVASLGPVIPP